jgi:drug/metabolite transporter (DMT)-like permease
MSPTALALVLAGACCHAWWNIVAKKAGGGLPFVWLFGMVSLAAAAPVAAWAWWREPPHFSAWMWLAAVASGVVHVVYSLVLQHGYKVGEFAVVYPVARGSGPVLSVLGALIVLAEQPSSWGWTGIALVLAGVFLSAGGLRIVLGDGIGQRHVGVAWGLLTGACIACYTVIDGWAVKTLGMAPLLFYSVGLLCRAALLAPWALRQPDRLRGQWQAQRRAIVTVGLLSPLAYGLVLTALQTAPLSYVAPVREVSMLIGTLVGARLLQEALRPAQVAGTALMLLGVLGLAWA